MKKHKVILPAEMKWDPHPQLPKIKVAYMLSKRDDDIDITCALVHLPVGAQVEKHFHENSDGINYVVRGKAKMWIDGIGMYPWLQGASRGFPRGCGTNLMMLRKT